MKRIFRLFCGIFAATLLLCVIFGITISSAVNETGIEGSTVRFKTPGFVLRLLNGKPDEIKEYRENWCL